MVKRMVSNVFKNKQPSIPDNVHPFADNGSLSAVSIQWTFNFGLLEVRFLIIAFSSLFGELELVRSTSTVVPTFGTFFGTCPSFLHAAKENIKFATGKIKSNTIIMNSAIDEL